MKSIKLTIAALAAATVLASAFAIGADDDGMQHGGPGMMMHEGPGMGGMPGMMMHGGGHGPMGIPGVDLTEAQRDKVFAIMHAQAPAMHEQMKAVHKAHEALREATHADKFDEAKAQAASQQLGAAVSAMALQHAKVHAQIFALLTPEQRKQATSAQAHRGGHH
jgi:protein CpxP